MISKYSVGWQTNYRGPNRAKHSVRARCPEERLSDCWWWRLSRDRSFLGLLGIGGLLLAAASVASVGAHGAESVEDAVLLGSLGDGTELDLGLLVLDGHGVTLDLDGLLELLGGGVGDETLLGLVLTAGEHNKLALVGVETGNVHLVLLLAGAGSSVIDGDANGAGDGGGDLGSLQLLQGEATAVADLTGVLAGGLGHDGSEALGRAGEDARSLCDSILVSLDLLSGLVEVGLGPLLPVLAQMHVDDHVVMLDHC